VWQKKVPKSSPAEFLNTDDFSKYAEKLNIASGNEVWGHFDLQEEVQFLSEKINENKCVVLAKFTHLSLRVLNADNGEQWQCHPVLGVYQNLKEDEYGDE
jgi:CRISPR-associated endonuclease/helicase Cas3